MDDPIRDDQAVVVNVEGRGLVVIAGCAQGITGVEQVWAVIGGFHLGRATTEQITRTIAELRAIGPRLVMPTHCTGFAAVHLLAEAMPDEFVVGAVGTRLAF